MWNVAGVKFLFKTQVKILSFRTKFDFQLCVCPGEMQFMPIKMKQLISVLLQSYTAG